MTSEPEKLASPASLRKRLKIFRVVEGDKPGVFVKDEVLDESHTFEPWQFFVLEVMFGCEDFAQLQSVFEDRFGKALTVAEMDEVFEEATKHKWFSLEAMDHALVVAFNKRKEGFDTSASPVMKSAAPAAPAAPAKGDAPKDQEADKKGEMPPGVHDALGMDDAIKKKIWKLFDPRPVLRLTNPFLMPLRFGVYLLPLLLIAALGIMVKYSNELGFAFETRHRDVPLIKHLAISMVTDNLLATWVTCMAALTFRATPSVFGIVLHLYVLPRFISKIGHTKQLSRRERMWLHACPMLMRLTLFSLGILAWYGFGSTNSFLSTFGLTIATASTISLSITANPLIKSNAYHLLSAYINEPYLRSKSSRALIDKFRDATYQKSDNGVLAVYALASAVYVLVAIGFLMYLLDRVLQFHLGGPSILLWAAVGVIITAVMVSKLRRLAAFYARSTQFEQWRDRAMPERKPEDKKKEPTSPGAFAFRASTLVLLAMMFLPYTREIGASFTVYADRTQEITTPIAGLVEEILYDGGEFLEEAAVLGHLSSSDDEVQVKTLEAKIAEQQAIIAELRSRPLPEAVRLAQSALETAAARARLSGEQLEHLEQVYAQTPPEVKLAQRKVELAQSNLVTEQTRETFSRGELERMQALYERDATSLEDVEDARREHEVDLSQVEQARSDVQVAQADLDLKTENAYDELVDLRKEHALDLQHQAEAQANLELVRVGAKPEEIAAAEAKLQGWTEERDYHQARVDSSTYSMPFDGTLVATRLKDKVGSYIEKGELIARVENTQSVLLQLDIPEPDVGEVRLDADVHARLPAFFDDVVPGKVTKIDSQVIEQPDGPVVRVTVRVENPEGKLRSGMTGYAKIQGQVEPTWKVLSLGLMRFLKVEVWSWVP